MDLNKIRCLVVDDEIIARHGLMRQLNELSGVEIVGEANNFDDFIFLYEKEKPDVVFLDISLQKENAIERITSLDNDKLPSIVFVTAYSHYAQKSYDCNAIDYLMKPVSKERLEKSINKVKQSMDKRPYINESSTLFIKSNGKFYRITISDILYVQSMENYVQIYTSAQKFTCKITMDQVCKSLPEDQFMRVHRSFLINKNRVDTIDKLTLSVQGTKIPVSREKKKTVYNELMNNCKFTSD